MFSIAWSVKRLPSLRSIHSRECKPDDRLREAMQGPKRKGWIASSQELLAMTEEAASIPQAHPKENDSREAVAIKVRELREPHLSLDMQQSRKRRAFARRLVSTYA
jgi:hypothetical protein